MSFLRHFKSNLLLNVNSFEDILLNDDVFIYLFILKQPKLKLPAHLTITKILKSVYFSFQVTTYDGPEIRVSGQEGGLVHISCPYDSGYETYPKYFYKGIYVHMKLVIQTTDKMCKQRTEKRKYDLCDDTKKRILRVTIYDLDLSDTGTYLCEIDTYGFDPKTEVQLKVHKGL